jgi:hypothetical protein
MSHTFFHYWEGKNVLIMNVLSLYWSCVWSLYWKVRGRKNIIRNYLIKHFYVVIPIIFLALCFKCFYSYMNVSCSIFVGHLQKWWSLLCLYGITAWCPNEKTNCFFLVGENVLATPLLTSPFCIILERCVNWNPESYRYKKVHCQLSHPSPYLANHLLF